MRATTRTVWAVECRSKCKLDGDRRWLDPAMAGMPAFFLTRAKARKWIEEKHGYLRQRKDLQREPHGWRMPKAVLCRVAVEWETTP